MGLILLPLAEVDLLLLDIAVFEKRHALNINEGGQGSRWTVSEDLKR